MFAEPPQPPLIFQMLCVSDAGGGWAEMCLYVFVVHDGCAFYC